MPGDKCSINGCGVCRRPKFKGISLFKLPEKGDDKQNAWRSEFLGKITATRVVDAEFRRQIENGNVHVSQLHFNEDDFNVCK